MRMFDRIAIVALAAFVPAAGSHAADLISYPVGEQAAMPVAADTGFDWGGFYAGVYGVGQLSPVQGTQYGAGVNLGVNAQFDFFLVGAEVALHGLTGGTIDTTYGQVLGRAGVLITEDVLLYAAAGYGIDLGWPAEDDVLAGGGLELALTDDITVRAQYLHGFSINGANPKDQFSIGANFHF
jgi:outer membrane immunogenic protein